MMKKILIATDFSISGNNALRYGAQLAAHLDASIILAHAFSLPMGGYDSIAPLTVISEMQTYALDALKDLRRELQNDLNFKGDIQCVAKAGSTEGIIAELVQERSINLVILGISANASGFKKHFLGSTVTDAIHELKVPVLVIPENTHYSRIERVMFAVDPTHYEDFAAFVIVRQLCEVLKAQLEILCVLPLTEDAASTEALKWHFANSLKDFPHTVKIVRSKNVADGLEHYVQIHNPDLVIFHPHQHGLLSRLFETGITARLVYSAKVPLLSFHQ
jgi:nucleotide-binding universal stress UspA family protein